VSFAQVLAIECLKTLAGTDPQRSGGVGHHCPNLVGDETVSRCEGNHFSLGDPGQAAR
jgi:hypothetical protein